VFERIFIHKLDYNSCAVEHLSARHSAEKLRVNLVEMVLSLTEHYDATTRRCARTDYCPNDVTEVHF
jgi:hypothetical protein